MNIRDIMTVSPPTVSQETSLAVAGSIMLDQDISALPVVDRDNRLVGIVTDGDLMRRPELGTVAEIGWWRGFLAPETSARDFVKTSGRRIGEIMTATVMTVQADSPLIDAVGLMTSRRIKQIPIIAQGALVGLLSRKNLLSVLVERLVAVDDTIRSDDFMATMIRKSIARSKWAPRDGVRVAVDGGDATLSGPIFSDVERQALLIIAETTGGIKAVHDQMVFVDPSSGIAFGAF